MFWKRHTSDGPVRVTFVVERTGFSGRDLVCLAVGLKQRGHRVQVLTSWPAGAFGEALAEADVPVARVFAHTRLGLVFAMRNAIARSKPDAVVAVEGEAGALAELAGLRLGPRTFAVVALEANLDVSANHLRRRLKYVLHRLADAVVSNSHAQRQRIVERAPYLAKRSHLIVNGVDLQAFARGEDGAAGGSPQDGALRLLAPARIDPQKNPFGLLAAVDLVHRERPALQLGVDWYGESSMPGDHHLARRQRRAQRRLRAYHDDLRQAINRRSLGARFRLHPPRKDVASLYGMAHAVCLPSFFEGTCNAILEAMACGVPLLVSRVADNPRLVREGRNGFLFDPQSPADIARAILRFADTSPERRRLMGLESRRMAEALPSAENFVEGYVELLGRVSRG